MPESDNFGFTATVTSINIGGQELVDQKPTDTEFSAAPPVIVYNTTSSIAHLPPFHPPSWAAPLHEYPRLVGDNILAINTVYLKGVLYTIVPWAIAGFLLLVLLPIPWFVYSSIKHRAPRARTIGWKTWTVYGVLFVLLLAGCFVMLGGVTEGTAGLSQTVDNIHLGVNTLNQSVSAISRVENLADDVSKIATDISVACGNASVSAAMAIVIAKADDIFGQMFDLAEVHRDLVRELDDIRGYFGDGHDIAKPIAYAVSGIVLAVSVILITTVAVALFLQNSGEYPRAWRHTSRCGCGFVVPLTLCALATCMIFVGVFLAGNLGAADVCIAPDTKLQSVLTGTEARFAELYMYCRGPDAEALQKLANDSTVFVQAIDPLIAELSDAGGVNGKCKNIAAGWEKTIEELHTQADQAISETTLVTKLLACERLNSIYRAAVYEGLCTKAGNGAMLAWIGYVIASVSLIALLIIILYVANPFYKASDQKDVFVASAALRRTGTSSSVAGRAISKVSKEKELLPGDSRVYSVSAFSDGNDSGSLSNFGRRGRGATPGNDVSCVVIS